jgi:hypothetical protein
MKISSKHFLIFCAVFLFFALNVNAQHIAINTDGSSAQTGVLLDLKGVNAKATTAVQNVFQVKSNDAAYQLKLRLILGTNATAGSRYAGMEVIDSTGAGSITYNPLSLQPNGGNVGIGTTAPGNILTVYTVGGATPLGATSIDVGSFSTQANAQSSYFFRVRDVGAGSTPFYLRGDGNVGIGTTNPRVSLECARILTNPWGAGTPAGHLLISDAGNIGMAMGVSNVSANYQGWIQAGNNASAGTYYNLLLEPNGGNVGIGTTNPEFKMHIYGGAGSSELLIIGEGSSTNERGLNIGYNYNSDYSWLQSTHQGSAFTPLSLNPSGGNVGIGTSTPGTPFYIYRSSATAGTISTIENPNTGTVAYAGYDVLSDKGAIEMRAYGSGWNGSLFTHAGLSLANMVELYADPITAGFPAGMLIGIKAPSPVIFATTDIERMRLDASGNLGIGTTAPGTLLEVKGSGTGKVNMGQWTGSTNYGSIYLNGAYATAGSYNLISSPTDPNLYINRPTGQGIYFRENNTNQMTILSGGNVGIGCTTPVYTLDVRGTLGVSGQITTSLALITTGVAACSDFRYKKDITPLPDALDNLLKLRGVNYFWKTKEFPDKQFTETKQIGFIAQELEKIYPEVVFTDKDGYKSVDYSRLTPILVEAIKEQQTIINKQQSTIDKVLAENADTKKRLEKLESLLGASSVEIQGKK